jgi:hypothetical protein
VNVARWVVVVFMTIHGVGHLIWFVSAWVPGRSIVNDRPWLLPGDITISSPTGRLYTVLALLAMVGFLGAAIALAGGRDSWTTRAMASSALSLVAVIPWWRASPGTTALSAALADVGLIVLALLPVASKLTAAG